MDPALAGIIGAIVGALISGFFTRQVTMRATRETTRTTHEEGRRNRRVKKVEMVQAKEDRYWERINDAWTWASSEDAEERKRGEAALRAMLEEEHLTKVAAALLRSATQDVLDVPLEDLPAPDDDVIAQGDSHWDEEVSDDHQDT